MGVNVFRYQKPYALIELSEANSETHVIISDEHYEFKDVRFYIDADLAIDRSKALGLNGVKTILLNTHALMAEFYKHEASCLAAQIGIDSVNYDVKQQGVEMSKSELWCVAIRPECDSPFEQCPAASKELAEKAVARYKSMNEKEGNEFVLEIFDHCVEVQVWEGSEEDHAKEMFYTESWFSEAMYWCDSLEMAERVFKFCEIVDCHKKGFPILKTSDFEKAKRFYGESKADVEG